MLVLFWECPIVFLKKTDLNSMKTHIQSVSYLLLICLLLFNSISCKNDSRLEYVGPIDPAKDPSGFSRALQIEGQNKAGNLPEQRSSSFQITNAQSSALAAQGANLYIPFTFTATEPITGIYLQVENADNYWDIPVTSQPTKGSYVFTVGIPRNVLAGRSKMKYNAYNAKRETTNTITMSTEIALTRDACSEGVYRESGSQGLTVRRLKLGDKAGEVLISYQMYSLPDRLDIQYNGEWVASTASTVLGKNDTPPPSVCYDGTVGYVSNTGILKVNYDPAKSKEIVLYISGCFGGTAWDISVQCPAAGCNPNPYLVQNFTIPPTQEGAFNTGIRVNANDYVFYNVRGSAIVDAARGTWAFGEGVTSAYNPVTDVSYDYTNADKKYSNYRFGQMLLSINGAIQGGADDYKLKATNCAIVEKAINNITFPIGNFGNYFVANTSGLIELTINDKDNKDNIAGRYEVEVWVMTPQAHQNRNDCNRCARAEPTRSGTGGYLDLFTPPNEWEYSVIDGFFSADCFHEGHTAYRGKSATVRGCQCVYNKDTKQLINTAGTILGTYDYGAPGTREHVILDVFTHEAYLARDRSFKYKVTSNVY